MAGLFAFARQSVPAQEPAAGSEPARQSKEAASTLQSLQGIEPEIKPAQWLRVQNTGQIRVNRVGMLNISSL